MTPKKQEISERLQREFDICDRHIERIKEARESIYESSIASNPF